MNTGLNTPGIVNTGFGVNFITREGDNLESPNLVCTEKEDSKCVLESLSQTQRTHIRRDPDEILQIHFMGGPGVQCKILV